MGMLEYAVAGAVKGGSDTYLDIRAEERKDERDISADRRTASMQEKRDNRLREHRITVEEMRQEHDSTERAIDRTSRSADAAAQRDWGTSERQGSEAHQTGMGIIDQIFRSGEADKGRKHDITMQGNAQDFTGEQNAFNRLLTRDEGAQNRALTRSEGSLARGHDTRLQKSDHDYGLSMQDDAQSHELKMPMTVGSGSDVVIPGELKPSDPSKPGLVYQNDDRLTGAGSGLSAKDATKFFAARSEKYFGQLDESGGYSLAGDDVMAQLASSAASAADRLWRQRGGSIDANTIWAVTYKAVKDSKAQTDADVKALEEELAAKNDEWFHGAEDLQDIKDIKAEIEAAEKEGKLTTMNPGTGGMLSMDTSNDTPPAQPEGTYVNGSPYAEGEIVERDGKRYVIKNGRPEPE